MKSVFKAIGVTDSKAKTKNADPERNAYNRSQNELLSGDNLALFNSAVVDVEIFRYLKWLCIFVNFLIIFLSEDELGLKLQAIWDGFRNISLSSEATSAEV
jgi:hypothetical protein